MGQINFGNQKPKYCNLQAIRNSGSKADIVLADGEIWLVDTNNVTKPADGKGKYNVYIKGDGVTMAKNLSLLSLDPNIVVPTALSQLADDANHRTVTDEDKYRWNSGSGGGASTTIGSSDDIKAVTDQATALTRLEFADKEYSTSAHSGLGRIYLKKDLQAIPVSETETIFNTLDADAIVAGIYSPTYNSVYDATYYAEYKRIIEDAMSEEESEFVPNTAAEQAAITAYNTVYNQAVGDGQTVEEATKLANIEYVNTYKNTISSTEDRTAASTYVDTPAKTTATNEATSEATSASLDAILVAYPDVTWVHRQYINGAFVEEDNNLYMNITPGSRFSAHYISFDVEAGDIYKIVAQKSDYAGSAWTTRLWTITEKPQAGDTRVKVLQAYKIDNQNNINEIVQEADFVEVEQDGRIWINYISYAGNIGQCVIERIHKTDNFIEVNHISNFTEPNTEYIIQYDYNLAGGVLDLPENSVLKFDGGSISNGYIRGNNSSISAFTSDSILPNIILVGKWKNDKFYSKWFGAVGDGITDDTNVLQNMLNLAENLNKQIELIWSGYTYRTIRGLYLKSNTIIRGGNIIADFTEPLDWILQTYSIYSNGNIMYGISKIVNYAYIASWQEFDGKNNQSLNHTTGSFIYDLSLQGKLLKHMVTPEGGDETSTKVWDGTYCPIYGGLKLNGASCPTDNVSISNVGIGIARGASLHCYDNHLSISAKFIAYTARATNTCVVTNSYLNALCNYNNPQRAENYTPYYLEYQKVNGQPLIGSGWGDVIDYIEGTGGIDDSDETKLRPKICSVKLNYASITFNNPITDAGADIGFAATNSELVINHPYFEGVKGCYIYAALTRVSVDMPIVNTDAEYDFIGNQCSFVLSNCSGRISGKGGVDGENHKYRLGNSSDLVQILGPKPADAPEDSRFKYLSTGDVVGIGIVNVSGTISTLTTEIEKYYKIASTVNTLAVILPAMENATSLKTVSIGLTVGATPNITFTSADSKPISYYGNYGYDNINSEYEISCLFNGTKWIIANTVVD